MYCKGILALRSSSLPATATSMPTETKNKKLRKLQENQTIKSELKIELTFVIGSKIRVDELIKLFAEVFIHLAKVIF